MKYAPRKFVVFKIAQTDRTLLGTCRLNTMSTTTDPTLSTL